MFTVLLNTRRRQQPLGAKRFFSLIAIVGVLSWTPNAVAQPSEIEQQRMELMRTRALQIKFTSTTEGFPNSLLSEPLFRYDDVPRGYVDGTLWRLGRDGRPLAIITTELHPKYLGGSGRVVYDLLSLSPKAFSARSPDLTWTPSESAVEMKSLDVAPQPAATASKRLFQMKRIIQRFSANQVVSEEDPEEKKLNLRLLPRPIDRYHPSDNEHADGATFLFVAGRMPGVIVFLESDGRRWHYGIGRLSAPSTLVVSLDGDAVWTVTPNSGTSTDAYNALNSPAAIPGDQPE